MSDLYADLRKLADGDLEHDDAREVGIAAMDKIEGLEMDLRMAVQTAYNRGAEEWAALNYPQWIEWLKASKENKR